MYKTDHHFSMQKPYAPINLTKKFPQDIQCIITSTHPDKGSLYISNIEAAENINTLKKHRITAVMSCAKGYELKHPATAIPHYKYIPTVDKDECDISCHFEEAVDFITKHIAHTNILVHCIAGVSRSVSMVLAYFIRQHKMKYQDAYDLVKSKRKIIHPNDGFIRQLKQYYESKSKTGQRRRDSSPLNITSTLNNAKRNKYLENNVLKQFKSVQYMEDATQAKDRLGLFARQNSSQFTPKKLDYQPATTKNQNYETNLGLKRTTTAFFTPSKTSYPSNKEQLLQMYSRQPKTQNVNRYPPDDKILNAQNKNQNRQYKSVSPTKKIESAADNTKQLAGRRLQFQEMNRELTQKIEKIREKYQNQRKRLYERYQSGDKKQQSSTAYDKNTTIGSIYQDRLAAQERKISATLERPKQQRDDYVKSVILREGKISSQRRVNLGLEAGQPYINTYQNTYAAKKDYKYQSVLAGRLDRVAGTAYNNYLRYDYGYTFQRY